MMEARSSSPGMPTPVVITDVKEWGNVLQQVALEAVQQKPRVIALDAGCGSRSHVRYPTHVHLVGLDDCEAAIMQNTQIHECIVGDLQTYPLPPARFDVITCIDVLEHVPFPEKALENMWRALSPGGLLIIRAPYLYSVKGFITKYTPHWVHVAFRRYVLGLPNAGKPGHPPFKTFLKRGMTPQAIVQWAISRNGRIIRFYLFAGEDPYLLSRKSLLAYRMFRLLTFLVSVLALGRFREYSDYLLVIQKDDKVPDPK